MNIGKAPSGWSLVSSSSLGRNYFFRLVQECQINLWPWPTTVEQQLTKEVFSPVTEWDVIRYWNRKRCRQDSRLLLCFLMPFLAISALCSAKPSLDGWYGETHLWHMQADRLLYCLANVATMHLPLDFCIRSWPLHIVSCKRLHLSNARISGMQLF